MSNNIDTLALVARPSEDIPVISIELWCILEDCHYHWLITFTHPSGDTTSASREETIPVRWIKDIPREKAISTIKFPVTYWCPDLRTLAVQVWNSIEDRGYSCIDFVYFLIWDYVRQGYIPENQIRDLRNRMVAVEEEQSSFHVPEQPREQGS